MYIYQSKLFRAGSIVFVIGVMLLVALNILTPLRLTTDSIRYLNIMEYLDGKLGPASDAATDFFPHGYPYFLLLLEKVGILSSAVIVIINILAVIGSGLMFCRLFEVKNKWIFISFLLLSFISIKHFTLPLSDQLFTLVMLVACYDWKQTFEKKYKHLLPALLFTGLAVYLRTAGIVIPAGVVCFAVYSNRNRVFKGAVTKGIFLLLCIGLVVLALMNIALLEQKVDYVRQLELGKMLQEPQFIISRMGVHMQEMGELMINIPASQIGRLLHIDSTELVKWIYVLAGIGVCIVAVRNIIKLKVHQTHTGWVLFAYFLMILVWPFYDTRFLIPAIPFVLYLVFPFFHRKEVGKGTVITTAIYILFGGVSLGYSTMLSVDKEKFLQYYGNEPKLTEAYRKYFAKEPLAGPVPQATDNNPDRLLYLLYTYDK